MEICEEEEEDEVLTMDEETIVETNVQRKIGVIGARPGRTLLPTAGARRRTANDHKTKDRTSVTIAEKKVIREKIARSGGREMLYETVEVFKGMEETNAYKTSLVINNDLCHPPPSVRR